MCVRLSLVICFVVNTRAGNAFKPSDSERTASVTRAGQQFRLRAFAHTHTSRVICAGAGFARLVYANAPSAAECASARSFILRV